MATRQSFNQWARRFSEILSNKNSLRLQLRAKVTLGVVLPLIVILGAFTVIEYARHREVVISNLSLLAAHSGKVIESNLRQQMLKSDFEELQKLLDVIGGNDEFRVVYLLDMDGRVIFAPNGEGTGQRLDNRQPDCQPCHRLQPEERPRSVVVSASDGQRVFRSMHPIENSPACAQCHDSQQRLIGMLLTDISMAPVEAPLASHLRESVLWWAGTILVTVLVVNLAISRLVLRRLEGLANAIAGFGKGRLPPPIPEGGDDEIGQLAGAFNDMAVQVEARNAENRALSESLQRQSTQRGKLLKRLITAQEDERRRVARELHDELGQALSGLALQTEAIQRLIPSDTSRAAQFLKQTRSLINETTERMYDLILALRPSVLDDLGLVAALNAHAERLLEGTGIDFHIDAGGLSERLSSNIETALYRIFQEALTNIVRHAGASNVYLTLSTKDNAIVGEIVDDGRGFDTENTQASSDGPRGLGLMGMQERVALCGGKMEIDSRPGGGTRILIRIPLLEENDG